MKKILVLFLLIAGILLSVSCAGGEAPASEVFSSDFSMDGEKLDFNGADIDIFFSLVSFYSPGFLMGFPEDSLFYELVDTRIRDIEKELNANIGYDSSTEAADTIILMESMGGEVSHGICVDESNRLIGSAKKGLLLDLTAYPEYLDYTNTAKFGTREYLKGAMWNGGLYGVLPFTWPIIPYSSMIGLLCVNEKLIKQLGLTDPRDYSENGVWDYDMFESQIPLYAHTNGAGEYVYAFESTTHFLFTTLQASSGAGVSYYENGQYNLTNKSSTIIEAYTRGIDLFYGSLSEYVFRNEDWPALRQDFIDERSVTALVNSLNILQTSNSLAYELDDFALVSFPRGPQAPADGTGACMWSIEGTTSIPSLFIESDLATIVLNMLYEPLDGFETREKLNDYMRRYILYDDRDVECLNHNFDTAIYNYRNENLTDMLISISNSRSVTAWIEAFEAADETNRAKYLEIIEETADLLYGNSY